MSHLLFPEVLEPLEPLEPRSPPSPLSLSSLSPLSPLSFSDASLFSELLSDASILSDRSERSDFSDLSDLSAPSNGSAPSERSLRSDLSGSVEEFVAFSHLAMSSISFRLALIPLTQPFRSSCETEHTHTCNRVTIGNTLIFFTQMGLCLYLILSQEDVVSFSSGPENKKHIN